MSFLKDIVLELHNCLHEFEPEDEMPMVWSREFQQRLAQNANHWDDQQRRASHVANMDFQDERDADIVIPYDDDPQYSATERDLGAVLDFDVEYTEEEEEEGRFKTKWGTAFRQYLNSGDEEEEEQKAYAKLPKRGAATEYGDDCPECFGTGMEFPRLKGDCPSCNGRGKVSKEEEQEDEVEIGGNLNITDDPEKVAKAKRLRDRARKVRDEARDAREKAKDKNDGGIGGVGDEADDFGDAVEDQNDEWDDPDLQGTIRTIPNTHLVYKRQQEDGTFDELWHYNIGDDFKKELKIRRAILAGTDIPINKMKSPDGNQTYELWTIGNGQMLKIQGLPN